MKTIKLQSAMEYLMTYGWALLIISVVIGALAAIGLFNGNPLGTTCIAATGFSCQVTQYIAGATGTPNSGNLIIIFGQASGTSWTTATIYYVNTSQEATVLTSGLSSIIITSNTLTSGLSSGVSTTVTIPISGPVKVATGLSGYLWVAYQTSSVSSGWIDAQIGSITAKAT